MLRLMPHINRNVYTFSGFVIFKCYNVQIGRREEIHVFLCHNSCDTIKNKSNEYPYPIRTASENNCFSVNHLRLAYIAWITTKAWLYSTPLLSVESNRCHAQQFLRIDWTQEISQHWNWHYLEELFASFFLSIYFSKSKLVLYHSLYTQITWFSTCSLN